jgi:hypothetical protein
MDPIKHRLIPRNIACRISVDAVKAKKTGADWNYVELK